MSASPDGKPAGSGCLFFFWPFLILGAICVALGAKGGYDQWAFRRVAVHGTGEVVGHDSAPGSRGQNFHPLVRYTTAAGESLQFRCFYAYPKETYPLGASVDLLYDPAAPRRAEVDSNQSRYRVYLMPLFGLGLWLLSLLGGAIGSLLLRRARAKAGD